MHLNEKIKFNDWYLKMDPPIWVTANFECMNEPLESNKDNFIDKLFVNKSVAVGYINVKIPDYDNLNLENHGYNNYFGEYCVEWLANEMLEIDIYMKRFFL